MASKKKTLDELKAEQKRLSDLIKKKQKETEAKALQKMGEVYIRYLAKMQDSDKVNMLIREVDLSGDELSIVRDRYMKEKKKLSSPTAP